MINTIINKDCMRVFNHMGDDSVTLTLTDIPYDKVNRTDNGLRKLDKGNADVSTFCLKDFLEQIYRVTNGTIIIFCGKGQMSDIFNFFEHKQNTRKGTVRQIIWEKTNPSPMNGQHIYLSGIENAVWFKKRGATFNAYCKNTVFRYPCGRSKLHPTEKNHGLLKELILDNTNVGDVVFDPCCGSGSCLLVAKENGRQYIGIEIDRRYCAIAQKRLQNLCYYKQLKFEEDVI